MPTDNTTDQATPAADNQDQATSTTPDTVDTTAEEQPQSDPSQEQGTSGQEPTNGTIDDLPDWAQKQIRDLRAESAKYRTRANQTAEEKDAERDQLVQQLGKALGLVDDETADPDQLVKQAVEERDTMAAQLRDYRQRDAIRKAAGNADVELLTALLKSDNAFAQLDMQADDYQDQVSTMVADAITAHPSLIAQAAPTASGVDTSTTTRGADRKITREDLNSMTAEDILKASREGKLAHLMQ